jgi:hypothetical protein
MSKIKKKSARRSKKKPFQSPPSFKHTELFRWADYFELVCLFNLDKSISKGDVYSIMAPLLRDSIIDKEEFESSDDGAEKDILPSNESPTDQYRFFCDELFKMFEYRTLVYKAFYPFKIKEGNLLQLKPSLYIKCKLYIYLLSCSNLSFFKDAQSNLTTEFEILSKESLKRFISAKAEIHHFGANVRPSSYSGNLYAKIVKLASDLNCDLIAQKEDFSPKDTGDGGLDIVAWYPFKDMKWSRFIILAQCKCSEEWIDLRFSSSLDAWQGKIGFKQHINNMTFIPMCYRRQNGAWHKSHNVSGTILIDRQRLIDCLGDNVDFFKKYNSVKFVDKMLDLIL